MDQETQRPDITKKRVVCRLPGSDTVIIRRDVEYRAAARDVLTLDIYSPPEAKKEGRTPAVVFVLGYSDVGFQKALGCSQKEMGSYVSWGKLIASSGLVAIAYLTRDPAQDIHAVLRYLRRNAASLGIDENRIGLWACSGNVPNALSVLMQEPSDYLKCAVLCYGFMLDLQGGASVAEAAKTWGFVNPCAGRSVADLPPDRPLLIVRAGRDETPHLNETMDRFVAEALIGNLPLTFINHAAAPHAFDLMDDSETSREIIGQILAFLRHHLLPQAIRRSPCQDQDPPI